MIKEIRKVLKERLSVNDDVITARMRLVKKIENYFYKSCRPKFTLVFGLTGENLIDVKVTIVTDESQFESSPGRWTPEKKELQVTCLFNEGKQRLYIPYGTLDHELNHAFRFFKNGGKNISGKSPGGEELYYKACKIIESGTRASDVGVSMVFYYAYHQEKDAFAQEFYTELTKNKNENWETVLKNWDVYDNLILLRKFFNNPKNKNDIEETIRLLYPGFIYEQVKDLCEKTVSTYIKAIGKVITRFKEDQATPMDDFPRTKLRNIINKNQQ